MAVINDQYIYKAKEILKLIISSGSEAYIVGESLCNIVLNRQLEEIEIFTGLPKDNLLQLLYDYKTTEINNHTILLEYIGFKFKISIAHTYEFKIKAKPNISKRHYSTSLMEFLEQKDFTINSLAMGINNVIYDCYNGREDLNKKRLRMISENPSLVFVASPIKILQGIALVSELGYRLDKTIYSAMKNKARLLKNVKLSDIAFEMKRIFEGKYFKKALKLLIKTKVYKRLPLYRHELKRLYKDYRHEDLDMFLGMCLVRDKSYNEAVGRTASNEHVFMMLVNLALTNPKANYDSLTLFSNGVDLCCKANMINYYLGKCNKKTKQIIKDYNALPVKKPCDLAFKGDDLLNLLKSMNPSLADDGDFVSNLIDDVLFNVLNKELLNEIESIKSYMINKIKETNYTKEVVENEEINDEKIPSTDQEPLNVDNDEKNNNELIENNTINEPFEGYYNLQKRQDELVKRIEGLELTNLESELDKEIERRIKQSGLLEGLTGTLLTSTYETLKKVYYDVLLNTEKYERLKNKNDE